MLGRAGYPNLWMNLGQGSLGFTLAAGDWRVVCVTSQNMTTNPRYEAGVVSTSPAVYEFHRAWLDPLLAGGDPLNVEAVARTVEAEGGD